MVKVRLINDCRRASRDHSAPPADDHRSKRRGQDQGPSFPRQPTALRRSSWIKIGNCGYGICGSSNGTYVNNQAHSRTTANFSRGINCGWRMSCLRRRAMAPARRDRVRHGRCLGRSRGASIVRVRRACSSRRVFLVRSVSVVRQFFHGCWSSSVAASSAAESSSAVLRYHETAEGSFIGIDTGDPPAAAVDSFPGIEHGLPDDRVTASQIRIADAIRMTHRIRSRPMTVRLHRFLKDFE